MGPLSAGNGKVMQFEMMPTACDLSETSLDDAACRLGILYLHCIKLYTTRGNAMNARQLQAVHGFELVIVPDGLMPTAYTWAIESGAGRLLGSTGCP
jgi:hypothetical protein